MMDKCNEYFLTILRAALRGESAPIEEDLSAEQWQQILHLGNTHHVLPMVYEAIYALPSVRQHCQGIMTFSRQQVFHQIMTQTMKTAEFLALEQHLQASGLRPLVVKGIICRQLYPQPDARSSGDEDILIPPEQFDAYHAAVTAFGMETPEDPEKIVYSYEVPYGKVGSPLYIEMHKSLFPPESGAYGEFNRFFEGVFDRAVCQEIQGVPVWTMCPTDHLFYLICHAFKHFLHSGFGIRQVCDIILYANAYGSQADWSQLLENCRAIHAERFCAALFRIGEKHLVFDPDKACYPDEWRCIEVDETLMLEDLLSSGLYGDSNMSRKHSSSITLDAVASQKNGKKAKGGIAASLFPPFRIMSARFHYLEKAPWLLPVAWVHRVVKYGKEIRTSRDNSAIDSLKIGQQRVDMMRSYGIIE